mmetsp:Transcript_99030/g.221502  ORF Transcript_99030/g.221502 Transcript_99030/m.221502 type:complete len:147 (+) Transcript_99030:2-442(+)
MGCNHMVCITCHMHFCWRCLKDIGDVRYGHFSNGSCQLFAVRQEEDGPAQVAAPAPIADPEVEELIGEAALDDLAMVCSECGEMNMKSDDPNACVCSHCLYEYCFLCGEPTFGVVRFFQSPCPRFTPVNLVTQVKQQMRQAYGGHA